MPKHVLFTRVYEKYVLFHQPTLTLNLLTTTIVARPSNVSKWQMGFNLAFKGLMHNFLHSLTICLLHCYPRHVSSINIPIFRKTNCIITASGILTLCKRLYSTPDESRLKGSATHTSTCWRCVAGTWISYRWVPCHPWCTHRTFLVVKKKTFSVFPWLWKISIKVGPLVFLL